MHSAVYKEGSWGWWTGKRGGRQHEKRVAVGESGGRHVAVSNRIPSTGGSGNEDISLPCVTRRPDKVTPLLIHWNDVRHFLSLNPIIFCFSQCAAGLHLWLLASEQQAGGHSHASH